MEYSDLVGVPFLLGGRSDALTEGLDCYGLVTEMGRRTGQSFPSRQYAQDNAIVAKMMSLQMSEWQRCDPCVGSVMLFKIRGRLCHVGFQINDFEFIHTWEGSGGVVIERIEDWIHRTEGHYRYVGK